MLTPDTTKPLDNAFGDRAGVTQPSNKIVRSHFGSISWCCY
ncbi:hypothetical protein [Gloeocapsopsis crepidinum]|nr:hypothetical protein [Gloeocapsopsis crepidinum]